MSISLRWLSASSVSRLRSVASSVFCWPPEVPAEATQGKSEPWRKDGLGFGGVPALNYDSDNGFGFGVVATTFFYDGHTKPYRALLTLQLFMTSKFVQDHNLRVDCPEHEATVGR